MLLKIMLYAGLIIMLYVQRKLVGTGEGDTLYSKLISFTWIIIGADSIRYIFVNQIHPIVDLVLSLISAVISLIMLVNMTKSIRAL